MSSQPSSRTARLVIILIIIGVILVIIALSTPPVRAAFSAWLGVGRAPGETVILTPVAVTDLPVDTPAATAKIPAASPTNGAAQASDPKIVQVSRDAGWNLLQPAWFPEGYAFTDVIFDARNKMVMLTYMATRPLNGSDQLTETKQITLVQALSNDQVPLQVAPSARLEEVQLGKTSGAYMLGAWDSEFVADQNEANGGHFQATWNSDLKVQNLFWQSGGVYLVLITDDPQVSKADLVHMASSANP